MLNFKLQERLLASRLFVNIIGLKTAYQLIYIVFNLIIIKKLSIDEYGIYSYVVALIVYFSNIPLLGLPVYLQKNIARNNDLNFRYFVVALCLAATALILVFQLALSMTTLQKLAIIIIISTNCIVGVVVSINDGIGRYSFQYKLFFLAGIWMVACVVHALFWQKSITFNIILTYWMLNSIIAIIVGLQAFFHLSRTTMKIVFDLKVSYLLIAMDLLLLYAISIPDAFAKFIDRYLAHRFINDNFLGIYSFNLMMVTTAYAIFVRPINSVLITRLAKAHLSLSETLQIMKKYYFYGLVIYLLLFCSYVPFSDKILSLLGLSKYAGTLHVFCICFANAVFYFLALPFVYLIALNDSKRKKILFSIVSLCVFNIPIILLVVNGTPNYFYSGFVLAYLLNLAVAIYFEFEFAFALLAMAIKGSNRLLRLKILIRFNAILRTSNLIKEEVE